MRFVKLVLQVAEYQVDIYRYNFSVSSRQTFVVYVFPCRLCLLFYAWMLLGLPHGEFCTCRSGDAPCKIPLAFVFPLCERNALPLTEDLPTCLVVCSVRRRTGSAKLNKCISLWNVSDGRCVYFDISTRGFSDQSEKRVSLL